MKDNEWIDIQERKPNCGTSVLVYSDKLEDYGMGFYYVICTGIGSCMNVWNSGPRGMLEKHITHWMILPEPPKFEKCWTCGSQNYKK